MACSMSMMLFAADLAEDDAVGGAHTQGVDDETTANGALAFDVARPGLQADDMVLLHLEFDGVFNGDDALGIADEAGEDVEQRGLAGTGAAAGDDGVHARFQRRR